MDYNTFLELHSNLILKTLIKLFYLIYIMEVITVYVFTNENNSSIVDVIYIGTFHQCFSALSWRNTFVLFKKCL